MAALHGHTDVKTDARIAELTRKLEVLDDVQVAEQAQQREQIVQQHAAGVTAALREVADLTAASTKALAEAEAKMREAVAAMKAHNAAEAGKRKTVGRLNTLTGTKNNPVDPESELDRKNSLRLMAVLKTITKHPSRYGHLTFPAITPTDKSWT